jgi:outer membrane biosynthesis protein TonB
MSSRAPNRANLSATEIEQRLQQPDLPDEERDALVEALSNRVTEELLAGRGAPSPKDPAAGTHSFEPPPVTVPPPQTQPTTPTAAQRQPERPPPASPPPPQPRRAAPKASQQQPNRLAGSRPDAPTRASRAGPAANAATDPPRKGFSRSLASLLALLLVAGGAWVVITLVNNSNLNSGGGTGGGVGTIDSDDTTDSATGGGSGGTGSGPAGKVRVDWVLEGVPYVATLETDGSSGVAEVTYVNPQTGDEITVREDLELERTGGAWHYTGSNPQDADTGASLSGSEYSPDVFYLQKNSGGWHFTKVCDLEGSRCAPADMTVL